jgi:hypothetical protein
MTERVVIGTIEDRFQKATITERFSRGTIDEVWKYKEDGNLVTITYAYRFYESQNTMYIPLVF